MGVCGIFFVIYNIMYKERLFSLQDLEYRDFHRRLNPDVPPERIIGVRVPALRQLAKEIRRAGEEQKLYKTLPHRYIEEDELHAFLINGEKNFDRTLMLVQAFLPHMQGWCVCDGLAPQALAKDKARLLQQVAVWLKSERVYTVRFAIGLLMRHFLQEDFKEEYLYTVAAVPREEYYIKMMQAWYFATALVFRYEAAVVLLEQRVLPLWVHNKTIQKAVESYRVTPEHKAYLRTLRRKI